MANAFKDFSVVANNNTTVGAANVAENCPASGINNAIRQELAYEVQFFMDANTIASASTTDLGTIAEGYINITGTTTITALGTPTNKVEYTVKFAGILTLTHNGTSLILPGGANITTAAGDIARFRHEGSGNWRCTGYQKANGEAVVSPTVPAPDYAAKTGDYTVILVDNEGVLNWTTAGFAANLTAAATLGNGFAVTIKNTASTGDVTIDPDGSETIDGAATRVLRPGDWAHIVCTGSAWLTVSGRYTSSAAAISTSSTDVFAHLMPFTPKNYGANFIADGSSPELGYSANQRVDVICANINSASTRGTAVYSDGTNINVSWGSATTALMSLSTFALVNLDYSKWTVELWFEV